MNKDAENKDESPVPGKLLVGLKSMRRNAIFVPPSVDDAILREARAHFQKVRPMSVFWRRPALWAAVAAVVIALVSVGTLWLKPSVPPALRGDVNGDGVVDVLDAYLLARIVEQDKADKRWDFNGDGKIDGLDVDWIANRIVQIVEVPGAKHAEETSQPGRESFALRQNQTRDEGGPS